MKNVNRKRKGFTLIELIVVVAIIGILAAIAIPRFAQSTIQANVKSFISNHSIIVSAISLYSSAHDGDTSLLTNNTAAFTATTGLLAPYINERDMLQFLNNTKGPEAGGANAATYTLTQNAGRVVLTSFYPTADDIDPNTGVAYIPALGAAAAGTLIFNP